MTDTLMTAAATVLTPSGPAPPLPGITPASPRPTTRTASPQTCTSSAVPLPGPKCPAPDAETNVFLALAAALTSHTRSPDSLTLARATQTSSPPGSRGARRSCRTATCVQILASRQMTRCDLGSKTDSWSVGRMQLRESYEDDLRSFAERSDHTEVSRRSGSDCHPPCD